jgi:alpha-mannosidase
VASSEKSEVRHIYEIPYGVLERKPYTPTFGWAGANGDWPAIHWAGVEQKEFSVALMNRGTPSYRMESGEGQTEIILLSVLRSPAIPTYLHEPQYYSMTNYDGMRDAGTHDFSFAIHAYEHRFCESDVVLDGEAYCTPLIAVQGLVTLPEMPAVQAENVRLGAVKWAEDGDALVYRLVEYRGKGECIHVCLPMSVKKAVKVNLLERQEEDLMITDHRVSLSLRPWEIATLKMVLQ